MKKYQIYILLYRIARALRYFSAKNLNLKAVKPQSIFLATNKEYLHVPIICILDISKEDSTLFNRSTTNLKENN
jgi:hypothetical protein